MSCRSTVQDMGAGGDSVGVVRAGKAAGDLDITAALQLKDP